MDKDDMVDVLNELIETSKDGEYGFRTCAERADAPDLKQLFERRAQACASSAAELQALVGQFGGEPEDGGTVKGAMHRGWVSVKDAVSSRDDLSVLEECERGEDAALAKYRKVVDSPALTGAAREVVVRQMDGVQKNHDEIKALRDTHRQQRKMAG